MKSFLVLLTVSAFLFSGCDKNSSDPNVDLQVNLSGKILYEHVGGTIHVYDTSTKTDVEIIDGEDPEVLDDETILYVYNYGYLELTSMDGARHGTFVEDTYMHFEYPRFSPDHKYVAVHNLNNSTVNDIKEGTNIYDGLGNFLVRIPELYHPSWTPTGEVVLSGSYQSVWGPQTGRSEGLWLLNKEMDNVTRIDNNLNEPCMPAVSPNGKKIAFVLNSHIWVIDINGANLTQVTKGQGSESNPAWSKDGKNIIFHHGENGSKMCAVSANALTTVDENCYVLLKDGQSLNSQHQITNF